MAEFVSETVLKRDLFSETRKGRFAGGTEPVIRRIVTAAPWWSRPLGWVLARREIRALSAVDGIAGVPKLFWTDRHGLCRSWSEGTPLHLARPADPAWYRDAHRLLGHRWHRTRRPVGRCRGAAARAAMARLNRFSPSSDRV